MPFPSVALEIVDELGSTSDALKRRAEAGEPGPVALLARRQTGGRGRLGRVWQTIPGNLHLSVLLRPGSLRHPGHWSILSAVTLADTVRPLVPQPDRLRLKWPNDLMLDGAKLAGILLEAGLSADPWLVIGFGVNLAGAPTDIDRPTASLAAFAPPPPEEFARTLLARLHDWSDRYVRHGFDPVREAWLADAQPGSPVTTSLGPDRISGILRGLADDGALLLDTPEGIVTVRTGDIA